MKILQGEKVKTEKMKKNQFKEYLKIGRFDLCADLMEDRIIKFLVNEIRKYERDYEYDSRQCLDTLCKKYFVKDKDIVSKIYIANEDVNEDDINRLRRLFILYENLLKEDMENE